MRIALTTSRVVLAGALAGLLSACGSSDSSQDYSKVSLYINEVQSSNQSTIADDNGEYDDWIEIYNPGTESVDLEGFLMSDSKNSEAIVGSVKVPAGGVVLLWADKDAEQGPGHLGFKLSSDGDQISISAPDGRELDKTEIGAIRTEGASWQRFPDGTGAFSWCTVPTPNALNGSACSVADTTAK
ncbi:MAG TPA: lamin tail domain-containing protein [Polyangiaceae bacterium]